MITLGNDKYLMYKGFQKLLHNYKGQIDLMTSSDNTIIILIIIQSGIELLNMFYVAFVNYSLQCLSWRILGSRKKYRWWIQCWTQNYYMIRLGSNILKELQSNAVILIQNMACARRKYWQKCLYNRSKI